jgi:hypothetical protein
MSNKRNKPKSKPRKRRLHVTTHMVVTEIGPDGEIRVLMTQEDCTLLPEGVTTSRPSDLFYDLIEKLGEE